MAESESGAGNIQRRERQYHSLYSGKLSGVMMFRRRTVSLMLVLMGLSFPPWFIDSVLADTAGSSIDPIRPVVSISITYDGEDLEAHIDNVIDAIRKYAKEEGFSYVDDEERPLYRLGCRVNRMKLTRDDGVDIVIDNFLKMEVFLMSIYYTSGPALDRSGPAIDELASSVSNYLYKSLGNQVKLKVDIRQYFDQEE